MFRPTGRSIGAAAAAVAALACAAVVGGPAAAAATRTVRACAVPATSPAYAARVAKALAAKEDVWGDALLARPGGPSYERARALLAPLLLARAAGGKPLTESGVYYLPFAQPDGPRGAGSVALHVADGSQVISRRVGGRSLDVFVGAAGTERFGSCLARLGQPALGGGYLPILETRYVDAAGAHYRQESFAAHVPQTASLVSFVRVSVDTRHAASAVTLRFAASTKGLHRSGRALVHDGRTSLVFAAGGSVRGSAVRYRIPRGTTRTIVVAWLNASSRVPGLAADAATYGTARQSVVDYWRGRLAEGMSISVPDARVENAERALVVQDLELTWRYSIGNPYEEFSFPESVDVAQVLGEQGFETVARSILRTSLTRKATTYPNWKKGERLVAAAELFRLFGDAQLVAQVTPVLSGYVAALGRQIDASSRGLLARERYSSDIPDSVFGLHSQTVVWEGLRAMASAWAATGRPVLAANALRLARKLEAGLRRAVSASQRRLPDGSLFVPIVLLDHERPYDSLADERLGSYWNLVMPYALASGFFAPGGVEARGILDYMQRHGSRLLGLVRAGAYALYGRTPPAGASGTDQVYGLNMARFLADNDEADQLVLSLVGNLAAGMTAGTFVSGEAASIAPLPGTAERAMYLPPNGASNAAFLETLRLMLVHETRDAAGNPSGLQLAFATPRPWLRPGRRVAVRNAPTSFGPVSFSIAAGHGTVDISVDEPQRAQPRSVALRLRLPTGSRLAGVTLGGRAYPRFDARTATIELPIERGPVTIEARVARR